MKHNKNNDTSNNSGIGQKKFNKIITLFSGSEVNDKLRSDILGDENSNDNDNNDFSGTTKGFQENETFKSKLSMWEKRLGTIDNEDATSTLTKNTSVPVNNNVSKQTVEKVKVETSKNNKTITAENKTKQIKKNINDDVVSDEQTKPVLVKSTNPIKNTTKASHSTKINTTPKNIISDKNDNDSDEHIVDNKPKTKQPVKQPVKKVISKQQTKTTDIKAKKNVVAVKSESESESESNSDESSEETVEVKKQQTNNKINKTTKPVTSPVSPTSKINSKAVTAKPASKPVIKTVPKTEVKSTIKSIPVVKKPSKPVSKPISDSDSDDEEDPFVIIPSKKK